MIDVKLEKIFKDPNTREDIYLLIIKIENNISTVSLTEDQWVQLYIRLKSIFDNE